MGDGRKRICDKVHDGQSMKWTRVTQSWEENGKTSEYERFEISLEVVNHREDTGRSQIRKYIERQFKQRRQKKTNRGQDQRESERERKADYLGAHLLITVLGWFRGADADSDRLLKPPFLYSEAVEAEWKPSRP